MKTIGLYCRVSTNEQADYGYSLEMQQKLLIEEVLNNYPGYTYECYVDSGISGKNITDRPEMQRLLKDVKEGKLIMVMSWNFSRISRERLDQEVFADILRRNGVYYRAISERIDTENNEESADILMTIIGLQSSLERKTLIKNTKMGLSAKASKGEPISGRALGYDLVINQETRKSELKINPYEASIVKQIFELYHNHDMGLKAITNHLNKKGYRTIKGKPFSVFTIKYMLQNPLYKGMIRHYTNTNWNVKKSRRRFSPDDIKLYKGKHEAIIDPTVFDKVQEKFASRSFKPGRPANNDFYLRGLIACPGCGQKMVCKRTYYTKKDGTRIMKKYYICSLFNRSGSSACSSHSIKSEVVEDIVKSHLSVLMNQQHVIDKIVDKYMNLINIDKTDNTINYNSVLKRQDELIKQKEKVLDLYLSGPFDKEMLDKKINVISTELKTVEDQLKESHVLSTTQKDTVNPEQIKTLLSKLFTNFDDVFNQSTGDQKNQLLRMLIEKIELTNDKQVKRVTYKIDAEDVPQSLKNDCGIFYFPNIHYNVNPDFTKIEFISI